MPTKSKSRSLRPSGSASDPLLEAVLALLPARGKFLVGVSGGRDSMVLLDVLVRAGFRRIVVCHLDHRLRGRASSADARFVERECARRGIPLESARASTARYSAHVGKSLELAARELRYAFFEECARRHRTSNLVLAHHAGDQVETCFFQFLRGAGAAGLAGMRPVASIGRIKVFRPFLGIDRGAIDDCVAVHGIRFREDASNADPLHSRNRIRHEVVPALEKIFGQSYRGAILRAAEILRLENDWMDGLVPDLPEEISCRELREWHPACQMRAVHRWLKMRGLEEPGFLETRRVLSLLDVESGPAKVSLPGESHARRRAGKIFFEAPEQ